MHYKRYKNILSAKNGMNIYRGCNHGCIYCDSRSKCYSMDHDFEDIEIKEDAPLILERQLKSRKNKAMIATGAMTDPYIPLEESIGYTRKCLEIIYKYGFGLAIHTKSNLVLRDLDLLKAINQKSKCIVQMTLTTYDDKLCKIIEPNVSTTSERVRALKILHNHSIPTVVWFTPILPFINDTLANTLGIVDLCHGASVKGIIYFGQGLTLREGNREHFYKVLDQHFPGLKERYHSKYGYSYGLTSDNEKLLSQAFYSKCRELDIVANNNELFKYMGTYEEKLGKQLSIWDY